ncbi:stage 0 sporulation protein [candidate division WOR-3 bacterium]|nr:stage 0 sporulation protein [candidate division WOR-3 bacterium]
MAEKDRSALVEFNIFKSDWCLLPANLDFAPGEMVIIGDEEGEDLGKLIMIDATGSRPTEGVVLRRATEEDLRVRTELDLKTRQTLEIFRRLRDEYRLEMQVVGAHWRLDKKKVCFYFISDQKLNFRMFHKALASALNVRVAIKQIGVRDHARLLGGIGPCGRILCCQQFLKELKPITLRMARQQNLFVEPTKISGLCGKLLCCLAYEEETYRWLLLCPRIGDPVKTARGVGTVTGVDPLTHQLSIRYQDGSETTVALEEVNTNE